MEKKEKEQVEGLAENAVRALTMMEDTVFEAVAMYRFLQKKGLVEDYKNDQENADRIRGLLARVLHQIEVDQTLERDKE